MIKIRLCLGKLDDSQKNWMMELIRPGFDDLGE